MATITLVGGMYHASMNCLGEQFTGVGDTEESATNAAYEAALPYAQEKALANVKRLALVNKLGWNVKGTSDRFH